MNQATIPAEVRDRIILAATELYQQNGQRSLPTVDQVRRAARVDMNAASVVMRDWRRQQQAVSVRATEIPPNVREALERSAAGLWAAFRDEIDERITRAREEAESRAGEAEAERDQALAEVTRLEAALSAAKAEATAQAEALTKEREEGRSALAEARADMATLAERTRQQEARLAELAGKLEAAEDRATDLQAENARLQERAGLDELRAQVKTLQDHLTAPAASKPEASARPKTRTRKRSGEKPEGG